MRVSRCAPFREFQIVDATTLPGVGSRVSGLPRRARPCSAITSSGRQLPKPNRRKLAPFAATLALRRCLVDVRRVGLFYRAEYEPRLLEELHLLERGMQRIRRRGNRIDRGVTGFLGCDPRFLGGASDLLLCLPEPLELVPIPVAGLPRFLRQYPEPLGLSPGSLGDHAMFFGDVAVRVGLLTAIFYTSGPALCIP